MDIRVLKYFVTVVEEENILKASQVLHITQPTLSRQLIDLEKELNCKLFIRSNRKITLTSEGLFLYNKAKEIILLQAKTINALKNSHEIISGDIYIGCAETNAFKFLAKTMTKIKKTHKDIPKDVFENPKIKNPSNCKVCHIDIEKGFIENENIKSFNEIK